MKADRTRVARRALLLTLVVVSGAVAWSLRRPAPPRAAEGQEAAGPGQGTTVSDLFVLRFRAGDREIALRARSMAGREGEATRFQGVEVTLPYVAEGRESTATITADECLYEPAPLRASFRGQVHVRTEDGFELWSETLKYWGDEQRVFSRQGVRFQRGTMSGTAGAMDYRTGEGLVLHGPVHMRLEDGAGSPTDIDAATAHASREERFVRFEGGVLVRQGGRELRSVQLELNLSPDLHAVERAAAIEDVDVVTAPGVGLPALRPKPEPPEGEGRGSAAAG